MLHIQQMGKENHIITVEKLKTAAATWHMVRCPFCGELWLELD